MSLVEEFDAWFATQERPARTVPGYDHAMFLRWLGPRLLKRYCSEATEEVPQTTEATEEVPQTTEATEEVPQTTEATEEVPQTLDLLSWRETGQRAYPLGSLDPPSALPKAPPTSPPKTRRARGERWLPPPHPDPKSLPVDRVDAFCDGSGWIDNGTAQPAGIGVVLLWGDVVLAEAGDPIGTGTNIVAELRALRRAIYMASELFPGVPLTVYSDSQWSLSACVPECDWNIHDRNLERLVHAIREQFLKHGQVTYQHCKGHRGLKDAVGDPAQERIIRGNNRADELAGEGRRRNSTGDGSAAVNASKPSGVP